MPKLVTPLNTAYPQGNAFRYMTAAQSAAVAAGNLRGLDVTDALVNAISTGVPVFLPDGYYPITRSLNPSGIRQFQLHGNPYKSQIINRARTADTPTLVLTDCLYFVVSGIVLGGRAGFRNDGLLINTAGGSHTGFGVFNDVCIESNGNGIELQKCNTIQFNRVSYWPSNGIGGILNTCDKGTRKHAVLARGSVEGNFSNEITLNACNLTGIDKTIDGHASVSITTPTLGGTQLVRLIDCELENTPIVLENIFNPQIDGCYLDQCSITLKRCRYGSIKDCFNPRSISLLGCQNIAIQNLAQGNVGSTLTIDKTCLNCALINASLVTLIDNGAHTTLLNWNLQGAAQRDKLNT